MAKSKKTVKNDKKQTDEIKPDLSLALTVADFDVTLLDKIDVYALFYAVRKNHYHFVLNISESSESDNPGNSVIRQYHIPRYRAASVAQAIDGASFPAGSLYQPLELTNSLNCVNLGLAITREKKLALVAYSESFAIEPDSGTTPMGQAFPLDGKNGKKLLENLKADVLLLKKVNKSMHKVKSQFSLDGVETPHGNAVSSKNKKIVEAILFEQMLLKKLNAEKFGIYSLFSSFTDFPNDAVLESVVGEIWAHYDLFEINFQSTWYIDLVARVFKCLGVPMSGQNDLSLIGDKQMKDLGSAIKKLDSEKIIMLAMMLGMHNAQTFVALGLACGLIDANIYANALSRYQPDSEEEQILRIEASYIALFRGLTQN